MPHCILLLRDDERSGLIRDKARQSRYPVKDLQPPFGFQPEAGADRCAWILRTFEHLATSFEAELAAGLQRRGVPNCVVVVDLPQKVPQAAYLNPLHNERDFHWNTVIGMLILSFPEIQWVLAGQPISWVPPLVPGHDLRPNLLGIEYGKTEEILRLQDEGYSPLFDGPGFYSTIRAGMVEDTWRATKDIPIRRSRAAAIDEETPYAFLTGYTAYRNGCCSYVVSTYAMMRRLFGDAQGSSIGLAFEDLFLGFPDLDLDDLANHLHISREELHLSNLDTRDVIFPGLSKVPVRAFVTVGHEHVPPKVIVTNAAYRSRRQRDEGVRFIEILKPVRGVFEIHMALGADAPCKLAWPPSIGEDDGDLGHSAPGRLLVIAQRLSSRAAGILAAGPIAPEHALYGATLAMNAKELLQDRTPTAAYEALALQHELEVTAECMFHGVAYNRQLKPRFDDVRSESEVISNWFAVDERKSADLDARITIVGALAARFRNFNQIDEEMDCLKEVRNLHPDLWLRQQTRERCTRPVGLAASTKAGLDRALTLTIYGIYAYAAAFTSSIRAMLGFLGAWIVGLGVGFAVFQHPEMGWGWRLAERLCAGIGDAVVAFFGLQAPAGTMQWWAWLPTFFAILAGFFHLGLVISYLFTRLARR